MVIEKHPSYGWATKAEVDAICNAQSPFHRKEMRKALDKKIKKRLKERKNGPTPKR